MQDVRARRFVLSGGQEVTVSVSVGLAHAPTDAVDLQSLYVKADQTLYDAKRFGRNRVGIVADSTTLLPAPEPSAWQGRPEQLQRLIRTALDNDSIEVAYQPIIELTSGLLVAVEALLRLTDEAGRPLPAQEVISAAEASGQIAELGRRVIQVAARQSAQWQADHGVLLPIAVNVSAAQVGQPGFPRDVLEAVERAGVPPEALWIELTESVLLETGSAGMAQLHELSEAGVPLAIDDFGTGYASLSLLHALPACTLKIDQSFVAGIPDDHRAVAIVAGVIDMASNFDMTCIAEGIESDTQRSYLAERGVLGQGYLLGRPDDAAAIDQIIARGRTSPSLSAV